MTDRIDDIICDLSDEDFCNLLEYINCLPLENPYELIDEVELDWNFLESLGFSKSIFHKSNIIKKIEFYLKFDLESRFISLIKKTKTCN